VTTDLCPTARHHTTSAQGSRHQFHSL